MVELTDVLREIDKSKDDDGGMGLIQAFRDRFATEYSTNFDFKGIKLPYWTKEKSGDQKDCNPIIDITQTKGEIKPLGRGDYAFNEYSGDIQVSQKDLRPQIFAPGASWQLPKADGGKTETRFMGDRWTWLSADGKQGGVTVSLTGQAYGWAEKTVINFLGQKMEWKNKQNRISFFIRRKGY